MVLSEFKGKKQYSIFYYFYLNRSVSQITLSRLTAGFYVLNDLETVPYRQDKPYEVYGMHWDTSRFRIAVS